MGRVYAIKPEVADKVLGVGTYARWQEVQGAFIDEQTRAFANDKRYSYDWANSMRMQLQADLAFAEKVDDDYLVFLERVCASGTGEFTEGEKILSVFVLAISILTLINDVLDDMFALGIVALFTALGAAGLGVEAKALQTLLERLQRELEKAKREIKEAYAQTIINLSVTAILACTGPLGWLTLGAIGIGQIVADTYLGPSTSDAATWGSRGNTTLGTAVSSSEKYLLESSKVAKVLKPAGKVIPVVGFVFDANEIALGYRNVDDLKRLMADTKKAQDKLIMKINIHKATLSALGVKFVELRKHVDERGKGWTAETRETLEGEMRRSGYRPRI